MLVMSARLQHEPFADPRWCLCPFSSFPCILQLQESVSIPMETIPVRSNQPMPDDALRKAFVMPHHTFIMEGNLAFA